jgi:hypothetical protein
LIIVNQSKVDHEINNSKKNFSEKNSLMFILSAFNSKKKLTLTIYLIKIKNAHKKISDEDTLESDCG